MSGPVSLSVLFFWAKKPDWTRLSSTSLYHNLVLCLCVCRSLSTSPTWGSLKEKEVLFRHWLCLHRPWGEVVRVNTLFNGGAMVGAMCSLFFEKVRHRLDGQVRPSNQLLWVANRAIIQLQAVWRGVLVLDYTRWRRPCAPPFPLSPCLHYFG